jgi:hypothetical protein
MRDEFASIRSSRGTLLLGSGLLAPKGPAVRMLNGPTRAKLDGGRRSHSLNTALYANGRRTATVLSNARQMNRS